jgi:RHS repeat-associated protein
MIYGTALSSAQLDASTTVAGTFAYSPASGTLLTAGSHTLSTTFTPTDTVDYTTTTTTVPVTVTKALPPITWPQPADIKYGTALNSTQLDATSTVAGSFAYTPVSGTVLSVGPHALLATLTPTDTTDYTTANLVAYLTVTPATNTFDSGTITLTVNGATAATTTYGSTSTPSTIAAGLSAGVSGSSPVTVTAVDDAIYLESKASGATTNYAYTLQTTTWNTTFTHPSFVYPAITSVLDGGQNLNAAGTTVYSYCVPGPTNPYCTAANNGYDAVGNLKTYTDTSLAKPLMGTWNFSYDSLNRVTLATDNQPANPSTNYCWGYDAFGNRTIQGGSNQAFAVGSPAAPGTSPCQPASGASFTSTWANYNTTANNNQFSSTSQAVGGVTYDGAGNITYDGVNQYLYDGDGRVCAVASSPIPGTTTLTGYIYGADGQRVAKGSITAWSCDPTLSGFKTINDYILGPSGEQVSEIGMNTATSTMVFQHTNVWAGGKLLATYDDDGIHFYFNDPLGTRRAQTDYAGVLEQTCSSLPFGDGQNCSNSTQFPTEHHFTGKERDAESGNDYFGARYYASSMGRWLSPDESLNGAIMELPQTWNKYSYEYNRPLYGTDPDGRCPPCIGAIVGGVVEGGWNLGSQLIQNHGDLSQVKWGTVGANALGGAVSGAIAGATGGGSLLADAFIGAGSNVAGGITTRIFDPNDNSDDVFDMGEISNDALSGFVGGGIGHVASEFVHEPQDLGPRPKNGRRRLAKYDKAASQETNLRNLALGAGIGAGSFPTHGVHAFINNFWNALDWLVMSPQNQPQPHITMKIVDCHDAQGNPCS